MIGTGKCLLSWISSSRQCFREKNKFLVKYSGFVFFFILVCLTSAAEFTFDSLNGLGCKVSFVDYYTRGLSPLEWPDTSTVGFLGSDGPGWVHREFIARCERSASRAANLHSTLEVYVS